MANFVNTFQTGYAAVRCALEWGQQHLPSAGTKTSVIARQALFATDVMDTAFTGWRVQKEMRKNDSSPNEQFYINCAIKAVALIALAALFVKGTNRYLIPQLNPLSLLQQTSIPKHSIDCGAKEVLETVTAIWTKTTLENLTTGLFFIRTVLDIYLARSDRQHVVRGLLNGATVFKAAQYRTLEVKSTTAFLLQRTNYSYYPSQLYPKLSEYFKVPVKKVEAIFHLNTQGLTESGLVESIQSIYDYSTKMFDKSVWGRHWLSKTAYRDYYTRVLTPFDEAQRSLDDLANFKLVYQVKIVGNPPPAPVQVRVLHEDKVWQSFKGIDIFKWIPQFCVPGQRVNHSEWIEAKLDYPLSRLDRFMINAKWFVSKLFQKN